MKILIISRYPPFPGGRENFVYELVHELSKNNDVMILTPDVDDNNNNNFKIKKYPNNLKLLKKIIKEYDPDIINSHTFYLSKDALRISKDMGVPFGITLHGDQFAIGDKQRQEIVKDITEESDFIITVSENGKQSLFKNVNKINLNKIYVIKNGVNLEKFKKDHSEKKEYKSELGIPKGKKIILTPTRIASYKGLDFFLESIIDNKEYLKKKNLLFVISVPDYPFSDEEFSLFKILRKKILDLNISDLIKFIFLEYKNIKKAYVISDFFLLPSEKEQLPISILEAMAFEIPIISTIVGGIPELLENNKDAYLIEYGDKNALILSIKRMLDNKKPDTKKTFKKVIGQYSIKNIAKKYVNIYKKYENKKY